MPIKLVVNGRSPMTIDTDSITLGSDPKCTVTFPDETDVWPIHAIVRKIGGRWRVEVREAESVFLQNSEQSREHWLSPGEPIRLTKNGPEITFESDDDDFLPLIPTLVSDSLERRSLPPIKNSPSSESIRVQPTPSLKPPSSTTIPTSKSPSSSTIPASKSSSSTNIPTTKSPSSGTIKARPPSSSTIKTTKSPSSGSIRSVNAAGNGPAKSRSSDANIPSTGAKRTRSGAQIPVRSTDDDEVIAGVPTLQRLSSFDESSSWDDLPPKRGRTSDQAEMQWIMMVVGRCLGGGAIVLVVWLAGSMAWKALSQPGVSGPPTATASATMDPSPTPAIPVVVPPVSIAPSRRKPTPKMQVQASTEALPVTEKPAEVESENEMASDDSVTPRVPGGNSMDTDSEELGSAENKKALPGDSGDDAPASPLLRATQGSVYAIVVEDADAVRRIRVGSAWAASERHLVTTATVASAVDEYQHDGMIALAVHPTSRRSIRIENTRIHKTYHEIEESIAKAIEKKNEKMLASAQATQVRFDLGVLDVEPNEQLANPLPFISKPLKNSKETVFAMVGFPLDKDDELSDAFDVGTLTERRSKKFLPKQLAQNKEMALTIQFTYDAVGRDWSGSPVLNGNNQVVGVYAQLPEPKTTISKRPYPENAVVWLGRLHEFAADVEKKNSTTQR